MKNVLLGSTAALAFGLGMGYSLTANAAGIDNPIWCCVALHEQCIEQGGSRRECNAVYTLCRMDIVDMCSYVFD